MHKNCFIQLSQRLEIQQITSTYPHVGMTEKLGERQGSSGTKIHALPVYGDCCLCACEQMGV
jgi:hypothetical protein